MLRLKPREARLVGLAAMAAAALGGYVYLVDPLVQRSRDAEGLAHAREATLERRRLLIAERPRLAAELEAVTRQLDSDSARLLHGPTAPLGASELQNFLKEVTSAGSLEVRSERVLPPVDREGLQEVPIEVTIAGSVRDTVSVLSRLERADRLLTLKDLKIRVAPSGPPRDLVVTLTVAGYLLPSSGPPAAPAAKENK